MQNQKLKKKNEEILGAYKKNCFKLKKTLEVLEIETPLSNNRNDSISLLDQSQISAIYHSESKSGRHSQFIADNKSDLSEIKSAIPQSYESKILKIKEINNIDQDPQKVGLS